MTTQSSTTRRTPQRKETLRATLGHVATEAGVAVSTASEILNNSSNSYASDQTRQRVLAAARKLQYRSNALARGLRVNKTGIIGFLVIETQTRVGPSEQDVYSYGIIRAVERELLESGHNILLSSMHAKDFETLELPSILAQGYVDGMIVLGAKDRTYAQWLAENCPNLVLVDEFADGIASVTAAHATGGAQAADYLWSLGHRQFALINGDKPNVNHELRMDGFRRRVCHLAEQAQAVLALSSPVANFVPSLIPTYHGDVLTDGGATAARAMLANADRPTAMFCANDHLAIHAIRALQEAGLNVPGDLSVVGFDDTDIAAHVVPALTTVRIDRAAMGQMAARMLMAQMSGEKPEIARRVESPTVLVERASTRQLIPTLAASAAHSSRPNNEIHGHPVSLAFAGEGSPTV